MNDRYFVLATFLTRQSLLFRRYDGCPEIGHQNAWCPYSGHTFEVFIFRQKFPNRYFRIWGRSPSKIFSKIFATWQEIAIVRNWGTSYVGYLIPDILYQAHTIDSISVLSKYYRLPAS